VVDFEINLSDSLQNYHVHRACPKLRGETRKRNISLPLLLVILPLRVYSKGPALMPLLKSQLELTFWNRMQDDQWL